MSQVDWITWKTDINEIINPQKVEEKIKNYLNELNPTTISTIYEEINHQIENGGLDRQSLIINGNSIANQKALDILENIEEIKNSIQELTQSIDYFCEEQKQVEKKQLIQAIEKKIEEEEKIKNNTIALNQKLQSDHLFIKKEEVEKIIEISDERIKQLKERLEKANQL